VDCDDEVRLVKRKHRTHTNAIDVSGVPGLAESIPVDPRWIGNHPFHVRHRRPEAP
jgi:hypothetical protein